MLHVILDRQRTDRAILVGFVDVLLERFHKPVGVKDAARMPVSGLKKASVVVSWFIAHCPSRFWSPYRYRVAFTPKAQSSSERTTIPAFHFLIIPSHLPLLSTHLPPGSRDAIRHVLAAEEAHAQPTPGPPAPNQPSSSSPTVCTLLLYSICYRPFARSPRIALATGAFAFACWAPLNFLFRRTQRRLTHCIAHTSHTFSRVSVHLPHPLRTPWPKFFFR